MAKLLIRFSTLVGYEFELDVSEERAEEVLDMDHNEKEKFILSENEKQTIQYEPYYLDAALETGYAFIKRVYE